MDRKQKEGDDRRSNRTMQNNNKRADRKVESNGSPEIPDRGGETSEMFGLPSGLFGKRKKHRKRVTLCS